MSNETDDGPARPVPAGNTLTVTPNRADHLKPYRWQDGQSGNPSGRPKAVTEFRRKSRELAMKAVEKLLLSIDSVETTSELVRVLEFASGHAGFLAIDKQSAVDAAFIRSVTQIATLDQLSAEQKREQIAQLVAMQQDQVGDE